mmetsp:Transcript_5340/g.12868  ORF Transcript_5340/g.12868 Transcript_5340/m.12868 type:complete len:248 (+) Transcript_5340:831-1574(+)
MFPFLFATFFRAYLVLVVLCSTSRTIPAAPVPITLQLRTSLSVTLVSCKRILASKACFIFGFMNWRKVAFSRLQNSASALVTSIVAVLFSSKMRARSPKYAFLPIVRMTLSPINTCTSPWAITYNDVASSPCLITQSFLAIFATVKAPASFVVKSWDKCLKMWTFFISTIFLTKSAVPSPLACGKSLFRTRFSLALSSTASIAPSGPAHGLPSALPRTSDSQNCPRESFVVTPESFPQSSPSTTTTR